MNEEWTFSFKKFVHKILLSSQFFGWKKAGWHCVNGAGTKWHCHWHLSLADDVGGSQG
jgi:hypothetical protein